MIPQSTAEFYRAQQRRTVATLGLVRREWARMGDDFDQSWQTIQPRVSLLTASAQLGAARSGAAYVPRVLAETSLDAPSAHEVVPSSLSGIASDGRTLDGLLYGAVTNAKTAAGNGATSTEALAVGGRWLDMAVHTAISDAGRQATQLSITMRTAVGGYVRMVNPPCCSRCAILAGKFFRWNSGFQRHPRCDCTHIPAREDTADNFTTDPQALVARGQVTDLRDSERKALDEGADLNRVVNARRGSSGLTTTELRQNRRLTPDGIYRTADNRDEAIRLLQQHGYLT